MAGERGIKGHAVMSFQNKNKQALMAGDMSGKGGGGRGRRRSRRRRREKKTAARSHI